ncbi:MAG: Zn-ribbon domain-containing OB-fold protein [Acidimicrobiales bacterium]
MSQAAVRAGLFTEGDSPALLGGRCGACARPHFPRSDTCPYCSAQEIEELELSRSGELWAWTSVSAPPPGYRGEIPYGFGVVELPEGLRVVTRLTESDPSRLELGQRMHIVLVPITSEDDGEVLTYAFSSEDPSAVPSGRRARGAARETGAP